MQQAHCPNCSMLLAPSVARCRYCGTSLDQKFWDRIAEHSASTATPTTKNIAPKPSPPGGATKALDPQPKKRSKAHEKPSEGGFKPPSVGWPAKALAIGIIAAFLGLVLMSESEGEQIATDCRSQCIAKEKQQTNPPKHFMSGCMQTCMRP